MDDAEVLGRRTVKAATRLLKSKIREHIYTTKAKEEGEGSRWAAMLIVEQGFARPALLEWNEVLAAWGDLDEAKKQAICKVVSGAFAPAASEVLTIFDEDQLWPMRKVIEQYHRVFNANTLLENLEKAG